MLRVRGLQLKVSGMQLRAKSLGFLQGLGFPCYTWGHFRADYPGDSEVLWSCIKSLYLGSCPFVGYDGQPSKRESKRES